MCSHSYIVYHARFPSLTAPQHLDTMPPDRFRQCAISVGLPGSRHGIGGPTIALENWTPLTQTWTGSPQARSLCMGRVYSWRGNGESGLCPVQSENWLAVGTRTVTACACRPVARRS